MKNDSKPEFFNSQKFEAEIQTNVEAQQLTGENEFRYYVDGTDSLANRGFVMSFLHVPSGESVFFKAFITAFNETYSCDWASESVYGRTDPIQSFKQTTRSITLSFQMPASTYSESFENLGRVQKLISYLYPSYDDVDNALTITQSPLIRLRIMNLVTNNDFAEAKKDYRSLYGIGNTRQTTSDGGTTRVSETIGTNDPPFGVDPNKGLLGIISNVNLNHNVDNIDYGTFSMADGTILPKMIEVALDFTVLHERTNGWQVGYQQDEDGGVMMENGIRVYKNQTRMTAGAYNVNLDADADQNLLGEAKAKSFLKGRRDQLNEEQERELNDQAKANAIAQGLVSPDGKALSNRRSKRVRKRLERTRKGNTIGSFLNPFDARPYRDQEQATSAQQAVNYADPEDKAPAPNVNNLNFFGFIS